MFNAEMVRFWVKSMFTLGPADTVSSASFLQLTVYLRLGDTPQGKTSRNPREIIQDLDASTPTVRTRRS